MSRRVDLSVERNKKNIKNNKEYIGYLGREWTTLAGIAIAMTISAWIASPVAFIEAWVLIFAVLAYLYLLARLKIKSAENSLANYYDQEELDELRKNKKKR